MISTASAGTAERNRPRGSCLRCRGPVREFPGQVFIHRFRGALPFAAPVFFFFMRPMVPGGPFQVHAQEAPYFLTVTRSEILSYSARGMVCRVTSSAGSLNGRASSTLSASAGSSFREGSEADLSRRNSDRAACHETSPRGFLRPRPWRRASPSVWPGGLLFDVLRDFAAWLQPATMPASIQNDGSMTISEEFHGSDSFRLSWGDSAACPGGVRVGSAAASTIESRP